MTQVTLTRLSLPSLPSQSTPTGMAPTLCKSAVTPTISSLCTAHKALHAPDPTFFVSFRFRPSFASINTIGFTSLRISHKAAAKPKLRALKDEGVFEFEVSPKEESELPSTIPPPSQDNYAANNSHTEATIDLKLPRRSLMVHFTCNACGERTQRLINRLAYERGTVFVQVGMLKALYSCTAGECLLGLGLHLLPTKSKWIYNHVYQFIGVNYYSHAYPQSIVDSFSIDKTLELGCLQHHKLVDNLGLVVEYDFREDVEKDANANQL